MADTKITSLQPPQVGYPVVPATDVLPIVVIADPGMATSGSTRKVTVNQILGAGGTATLASATITGALTANSVSSSSFVIASGPVAVNQTSKSVADFLSNSSRFLSWGDVSNDGSFQWYTGIGAAAPNLRMTLNSTGLGVGGSPNAKVSCAGFSSANVAPDFQINRSSSGTGIQTGPNLTFADGTANNTVAIQSTQGRFGVWNFGAGAWNERFNVDSSGNVGIGVTPSYKLDTYTTLQGAVTAKQFANRTANKILVKRFFGITADTALFSVECGTAGAGAMAAFEINVFATGQKSGSSGDRQFYGKWYVTRNLAGAFTITSAFSSGSSGAFTVAASGTSLNVNGIFSVISDGSACVEVTGYIGGRDTVVETALNVTMP